MSLRTYREIHRRRCREIHVGPVAVGGQAPVSVQSMTNTPTADADATIAQIAQLADAGADIVRVSSPDEASTARMTFSWSSTLSTTFNRNSICSG